MKTTFYGHFVAGEDQKGIRPNVESMMKYGVKSILDYSAEEDLSSNKSAKESLSTDLSLINCKRKLLDPAEIQFEKNTKIFMDCVDAVSTTTNSTGIGAVKLTSLLRPQLLLKFSSLISQMMKYESQNDKDNRWRLLDWKTLVKKSDEDFAKLFNEIPALKVSLTCVFLCQFSDVFKREFFKTQKRT
jgi:proline dehydrogenase